MKLSYDHLLGLEFDHGTQDCYEIGRMFFRDNFGLEFPAFARPERWWDHDQNLYMDHYFECGFRTIDVHPTDWRPADVMLIAYRSKVPNHAAIMVENGNMLHHFWGCRSVVEPYKGKWRDLTLAVLRHKDIEFKPDRSTEDLRNYLPPTVRARLDELERAAREAPEPNL